MVIDLDLVADGDSEGAADDLRSVFFFLGRGGGHEMTGTRSHMKNDKRSVRANLSA